MAYCSIAMGWVISGFIVRGDEESKNGCIELSMISLSPLLHPLSIYTVGLYSVSCLW